MFRRLSIAALMLVIAGCTTYGGYDRYRSDYGYYDGQGYDDGYYADDGYGYGSGAYEDRYDDYGYDYGYSSYSPFWGLDRYNCGFHGCSPYWNSYYGRPYGGWSLTFGNQWNYGSWGWYGAGWAPWYAYDYYRPHWHHPHRHEIRPKPPYLEDEDPRVLEVRSAPGEYLRVPSRGAAYAPTSQRPPISGRVTPMPKPDPRARPVERRGDISGRPAPDAGVPVWRTPSREPRRYDDRAPRARYQEPAEPRFGTPATAPSARYERPAPRPQPRYETPQPRYDAPQRRYEEPAPRPQPRYEAAQPRYESRPEPRVEREPAREPSASSQNDTRDEER